MPEFDCTPQPLPRFVKLSDDHIPLAGLRGQLRRAMAEAGFTERTEAGITVATRDSVRVRFSPADGHVTVRLHHPMLRHMPVLQSYLEYWRAYFTADTPDEVIAATINLAALDHRGHPPTATE